MVSRTRRISQAVVGIALATVGVAGLAVTWASGPALAEAGAADGHEAMDQMMAAMHGDEAAAHMHEIEGMEQMMDQCADMMDVMGGMMDGQGMSHMMRGMDAP